MVTKMKIKVIISVLLICVMTVSLCGCQLKKPESETNSTVGDRLIGTVITTESLNTFDMEAYLHENIEDVIKNTEDGEMVNIEGQKSEYNNKIYARQITLTYKTEEGEEIEHKEYVFDDIDGFWIFDAKIPSTETEESYTCLCSEGGLSNIHSKINNTDGELTALELTADLYYSYELWGTVFYMNPVYQESDGDIYCIEGTGHSVSGDKGSIDGDAKGSQSISDKITVTVDGEETVEESKITVNYIPVAIPTEVEFVFMGDDNKALSEKSFETKNVPSELTVPKGTEYAIVIQKSENGNTTEVAGKNCETAEYIAEDREGICSVHTVQLIW